MPLTGMAAINSRKTHCPVGHPYSGSNLLVREQYGHAYRLCRACKQRRDKEFDRRQRAVGRVSPAPSGRAWKPVPAVLVEDVAAANERLFALRDSHEAERRRRDEQRRHAAARQAEANWARVSPFLPYTRGEARPLALVVRVG